jgi:tetratricopeptide (TPR) repeat protein
LYTGVRLFRHDRETEQTVHTRKLTEPGPERPRALVRGLPWEIDAVLVGGLQREPADRYRSARDLERDLLHVLREEPIEHRRLSLLRRARLLYRRRRTLVNLTAGFAALAVLGVAGYIVSLRAEQANTLAESWRANRQRELAERRFEPAQDTVEQMLENVSDLDLLAVPLMEQARRRLGQVLVKAGRPDEAAAAFREALTLREPDEQARPTPEVWQQLAGLHFDLCGPCRARKQFRQALEEARQGEAVLAREPDQGARLADPLRREGWRVTHERCWRRSASRRPPCTWPWATWPRRRPPSPRTCRSASAWPTTSRPTRPTASTSPSPARAWPSSTKTAARRGRPRPISSERWSRPTGWPRASPATPASCGCN